MKSRTKLTHMNFIKDLYVNNKWWNLFYDEGMIGVKDFWINHDLQECCVAKNEEEFINLVIYEIGKHEGVEEFKKQIQNLLGIEPNN